MLSWIERWAIARLNRRRSIKLTKDNLIFSFYDDEGNGYYKFPKEIDMPINRMAKIQEFLMWMSRGVDQSEYIRAVEIAESGIEGGIKDGKGLAKIGFVLHELKDRCNMVIHSELFYNIIAAQIIRHDESPGNFNNDIHLQKVEQFKIMDKKDDSFFLNIQEYLGAFGLSNITKRQLEELLIQSESVRIAMERVLSSLSEK